jgi:SagB-type dehydrogenase family enzyme
LETTSKRSQETGCPEQPCSSKQRLIDLVETLSDYECGHLLKTVGDVAAGKRFWEDDAAVFYNEHIKMRALNARLEPSSVTAVIPESAGGIFAPIPIVKSYPDAPRVELPHSTPLPVSLTEALLRRRTERTYTGRPMTVQQVGTLLEHAAGVTGAIATYGYTKVPLRTFPSCGALQAPEVYVFVLSATAITPGLYHYDVRGHALELLREGRYSNVLHDLCPGQPDVETSSVVLAVTGCYDRLRWKYGPRAYRYICMDVGFLGQNLYLACTCLGLGCCGIAGFLDDAVEEVLGIDGEDEMALLMATVGVP